MSTVTIRNYNFPIHFSYKGWRVEIIDNTSLFSMKDIKVRVRMVVDSEEISSSIAHATARVIKIKEMQKRFMGVYRMNFMQEDPAVYQSEYNRILKLANDFARKKGTIDYTLGIVI